MANLLSQIVPWQHASRQEQIYLVLYLNQEYAGARQNQNVVKNPSLPGNFGSFIVNDWPIYDGPDPFRANVVARARGHHIQTSMDAAPLHYFISCSIVFMPGSSYPESTLLVQGMINNDIGKGEWTIVGGTGKFTLAQGAIYYDVVSRTRGTAEIKELHIGVFCTPMEKSKLRLMFIDFNTLEVDDAVQNGTELGTGGYGTVYKAEIRGITVAVKLNKYGSMQGRREFNQEVEILRSTRHENLVTLIGACSNRLALIYEFLPNGTLSDRLSGKSFSWEERIRATMSICAALELLHSAKPMPIAHGDLKPENILFDANNVCKLSDFGISRLLKYRSDTATPGHTTVTLRGTSCYMDPEFIRTSRLTPQSDVYALGIILLQLVTGKKDPVNLRYDVQEQNLCEQLVDSRLELDDRSKPDAVEMMRLGIQCSNDNRKDRPDLATEVLPMLQSMKSRAAR